MTRYLFVVPLLVLASPSLGQSAEDPEILCMGGLEIGATGVDERNFERPCNQSSVIIVTATATRQEVQKSGRSISLFRPDDIARLQPSTVADLIVTTPGVTASSNGGIGGFSAVRIRGAEGEQTFTLIDGVRVNDPASPGGGFDFGSLLVGNIERVEVLRGPNSVPWGSQAIGGVVSIVTAAPTRYREGSLRAEYGYKDRANLTGNIGIRSDTVRATFGGGYFRDGGISAVRSGTERDGYRQYAANSKVGVAISDTFDLDFRGYYADSRLEIDGFPPPFFGFADTPEIARTEQFFTYTGANLRLFEGKLTNRIAWTRANTDRDQFDAPGQAVPSFLARGRVDRFEYQGDATLLQKARAVFGAEHERSRLNDGFSTQRTRATSGYAQLILDPTDSLTLTGGARVDDYRTYGTKATLSGNLAWRPMRNTVVRATYGEGFKAPTLFQLFSFFGNAQLDPEKARSYEIGVEQWTDGGQFGFSVTAFQRDTSNQIDFISCFGSTTGICTNRPFGTYDNIARTRAKGVEAVLRARPSERLTLDANYTLLDTEDRTTGRVLVRRPRHSLNLAIDWEARDWLRLGASLRLASDSADTDFQTFARTTLDGYALATLRAVVPVSETLEFYGRVENLFDVRYETVSGYGTYGRNAHIGVRARF